jgi:branched-chain amino acid transport system substrate-binding protein
VSRLREGSGLTRPRSGLLLAVLGLLAGLAGCAGKDAAVVGDKIQGTTLTIYASLPMHGASSVTSEAVIGGAELALSRIHSKIGRYRIVFKPLDDSTVQRAEWDPGQTTLNARLAAQDSTAIGYLGDLNSGASAISIPVLNRVGIAQISPSNTAVGLTTTAPGAAPGEPQKYYPTGVRTFARVVPDDSVQTGALLKLQLSAGCTKTYVLDDGQVDGEDTAISFELAAQASKLQVVAVQSFDPNATDYSSLGTSVAQTGANCVLISAITENNTVLLTKQLAAALPQAMIFGSAAVAESTYASPARGGIPPALDPRILITSAALVRSAYPPSAGAFYNAYTTEYGPPEPYAIFGYEAMSLMLSSVDRATDHGRKAAQRWKVVSAIFSTHDRHSVIGTYSIDRNGDTTLRRYGVYRIVAGRLTFWKAIDA